MCITKPSYMLHIILDKNLVVIQKRKITLTLNKPAYIGVCILELKALKQSSQKF